MSLAPGRRVTANIRLAELLRRGGMGSVWRAQHLSLGTDVAVKFMSPQYLESEDLVTRFTREATSAAQIKSPHVVQILDHGVLDEGLPFIVMELLVGQDLGQRIKRRGPLPLGEIAAIVLQVGKALSKAHQAGILHRDIKPDNIFLLEDEGEVFVKVLDFGVAKLLEPSHAMTSTGSTVGTPFYMSPEQLLSAKHVDFQCDLWSLAVVAYRATTGRLPFHGDTLGALAIKVHEGKFIPASALRPDVPPALDAWFSRALQRNPASRFASLKDLVQGLARAVADPSAVATELPSFPTFVPGATLPAADLQRASASGVSASGAISRAAPGSSSSIQIAAVVASSVALLLVGAVITLLLTRPHAADPRLAPAASIAVPPEISAAAPRSIELSTAPPPAPADSIEAPAVPPVSSSAAPLAARPPSTSTARAPAIKGPATPTRPKDRGF
ncbi:MAG: protein kinase [Byssovorax sp.]